MKVAYSRPTDFAVAVVGTGAVLLTEAADLFNGRPMDATVLQLPSDWAGATTDVVRLQFTRATAFPVGVVGLVGANFLSLASNSGIKMAFTGRRIGDAGFTYDLGGNTALVRSDEVEYDGSIKALGMCDDGLDPIIGFQLSIYNDQDGSSPLAPGDFVYLGDVWASPAMEIDNEEEWELQDSDSDVPTSVGGQPWPTPYPPGRILPVAERKLIDVDEAFISGATPSYQRLRRLLGNGAVSIQIPRWRDSTGALDVHLMHQTALFCTTKFRKLPHDGADFYSASWTLTEIPALLAQ